MTVRNMHPAKVHPAITDSNGKQIDDQELSTTVTVQAVVLSHTRKADGSEEQIVESRRRFTRANNAAAWTEVTL